MSPVEGRKAGAGRPAARGDRPEKPFPHLLLDRRAGLRRSPGTAAGRGIRSACAGENGIGPDRAADRKAGNRLPDYSAAPDAPDGVSRWTGSPPPGGPTGAGTRRRTAKAGGGTQAGKKPGRRDETPAVPRDTKQDPSCCNPPPVMRPDRQDIDVASRSAKCSGSARKSPCESCKWRLLFPGRLPCYISRCSIRIGEWRSPDDR